MGNRFTPNQYYQIIKGLDSMKEITLKANEGSWNLPITECEWIGMEKPNKFIVDATIYSKGAIVQEYKWDLRDADDNKYHLGIDPISQECIKNKPIIEDNMVNILVKQSESVTLKRAEDEINIKVSNLKTIKI